MCYSVHWPIDAAPIIKHNTHVLGSACSQQSRMTVNPFEVLLFPEAHIA